MESALATYRVLIVDDNEGIHDDFRSLLQPRREPDELDALAAEIFGDDVGADESGPELPSYRCDSVYQGPAALETVKDAVANGESYALAFVDIRMPPGWDGVETILHLWAVDPNIQMVLCSAYSDYSWEEIVQKLGVSDKLLILRKPFDPNSVKQLTLATTSRWQRERAARQRLRELEERLEQGRRHLTALDGGRSSTTAAELPPDIPPELQPQIRDSLEGLTRALDELACAELGPEHGELVERAQQLAAALRSAIEPGGPRA